MTMPFFITALALVLMAFPVGILALRSAYPNSRIVQGLWIAGLVLAAGAWLWTYFVTPPGLVAWRAPEWYPFLVGALVIGVPFAASHLLWRWRARTPPAIGAAVSTLICVAVCVVSLAALATFNDSCVYFDYNHDNGTSWCPEAWQAPSPLKRN